MATDLNHWKNIGIFFPFYQVDNQENLLALISALVSLLVIPNEKKPLLLLAYTHHKVFILISVYATRNVSTVFGIDNKK